MVRFTPGATVIRCRLCAASRHLSIRNVVALKSARRHLRSPIYVRRLDTHGPHGYPLECRDTVLPSGSRYSAGPISRIG